MPIYLILGTIVLNNLFSFSPNLKNLCLQLVLNVQFLNQIEEKDKELIVQKKVGPRKKGEKWDSANLLYFIQLRLNLNWIKANFQTRCQSSLMRSMFVRVKLDGFTKIWRKLVESNFPWVFCLWGTKEPQGPCLHSKKEHDLENNLQIYCLAKKEPYSPKK